MGRERELWRGGLASDAKGKRYKKRSVNKFSATEADPNVVITFRETGSYLGSCPITSALLAAT